MSTLRPLQNRAADRTGLGTMFALGKDEPIDTRSVRLVRQSIVWLGDGETERGLPASHPLCVVIGRMAKSFVYRGVWSLFRAPSALSNVRRKALLLRMAKSRWVTREDETASICATKLIREDDVLPFSGDAALPRAGWPILRMGTVPDELPARWDPEVQPYGERAVAGEELLLRDPVRAWLLEGSGCGMAIDRTHIGNSPGISIIASSELHLDPAAFVDGGDVLAIHHGEEGALAWSYARSRQAP